MRYFSQEMLGKLAGAIASQADHDDELLLQLARNHLCRLHEHIYPEFRKQNIILSLFKNSQCMPLLQSVSQFGRGASLSLAYLREPSQAVKVERLLGREEVAAPGTINPFHHPVIELRLTPEHFIVEMILSPDAWWDQQNFVGKLSVSRHRQAFYTLLKDLHVEYCLGFWQGTHLSDMHLTAAQFQHPRVMDEWMSTFAPGQDWFRIGIWYEHDAEALAAANIYETVSNQIRLLYPLYESLLWASDNNYRDFYEQ